MSVIVSLYNLQPSNRHDYSMTHMIISNKTIKFRQKSSGCQKQTLTGSESWVLKEEVTFYLTQIWKGIKGRIKTGQMRL